MLDVFADKSINHFFPFVKPELLSDEELAKLGLSEKRIAALKTDQRPPAELVKAVYLDVDALKAEGLNDAQIETLTVDFIERGLLPTPAVKTVQTVEVPTEPTGGDAVTTALLPTEPKKERKAKE